MMNDDVMQAFATALNSKAREMAEEMAREMVSASRADIDAAYERGISDGRKLGYTKARREDLLRLQRSCPEAWDGTDADFVDDAPQSVEPQPVAVDEDKPANVRAAIWANRITAKQGAVLDAVVGAVECGMNGQLSTSQLATLSDIGSGDVTIHLKALREKGCLSWTKSGGQTGVREFTINHERIAEMTRV